MRALLHAAVALAIAILPGQLMSSVFDNGRTIGVAAFAAGADAEHQPLRQYTNEAQPTAMACGFRSSAPWILEDLPRPTNPEAYKPIYCRVDLGEHEQVDIASLQAAVSILYPQARLCNASNCIAYWSIDSTWWRERLVAAQLISLLVALALLRLSGWSPSKERERIRTWTRDAVAIWLIALTFALSIVGTLIIGNPEDLLWIGAFRDTADSPAFVFLSSVIIGPLCEEAIFRVWMIPFLAKSMPVGIAVVLSSVFFALAHGDIGLATVGFAMVGAGLGLVWWRTRSYLACFIPHAALNI